MQAPCDVRLLCKLSYRGVSISAPVKWIGVAFVGPHPFGVVCIHVLICLRSHRLGDKRP